MRGAKFPDFCIQYSFTPCCVNYRIGKPDKAFERHMFTTPVICSRVLLYSLMFLA